MSLFNSQSIFPTRYTPRPANFLLAFLKALLAVNVIALVLCVAIYSHLLDSLSPTDGSSWIRTTMSFLGVTTSSGVMIAFVCFCFWLRHSRDNGVYLMNLTQPAEAHQVFKKICDIDPEQYGRNRYRSIFIRPMVYEYTLYRFDDSHDNYKKLYLSLASILGLCLMCIIAITLGVNFTNFDYFNQSKFVQFTVARVLLIPCILSLHAFITTTYANQQSYFERVTKGHQPRQHKTTSRQEVQLQ